MMQRIKINGYFYKIFGDVCPVCKNNILGNNFCHTNDHNYFYNFISLVSNNEYYICHLFENTIAISINNFPDYDEIYFDFIDPYNKDFIKNAKHIFNICINNLIFL